MRKTVACLLAAALVLLAAPQIALAGHGGGEILGKAAPQGHGGGEIL